MIKLTKVILTMYRLPRAVKYYSDKREDEGRVDTDTDENKSKDVSYE